MTSGLDWKGRVGEVWAAEWQVTDRSLSALAVHLDDAILSVAPDMGGRALDIGCGAGATSLALATARPDLMVTGVDLSADLVKVAAVRTAHLPNCAMHRGDALDRADAVAPDLIVSRHGVMFFDDPIEAFRRLHRAARPDARMVFSCFADRAQNRFATLADELTGTGAPAGNVAPGPFAFADPHRVADILEQAGWTVHSAARVEFAYRVGQGPDAVAEGVQFLSRIGPLARAMKDRAESDRDALVRALAAELARCAVGDAIDLPATAWIWRARAGETA